MSSSRANAAARQRRASDNLTLTRQQQMQQQQMQQQQMQQRQLQQRQLQQQTQQQTQQLQQNMANSGPERVAVTKISISDAIGLICGRLGKVEETLSEICNEGLVIADEYAGNQNNTNSNNNNQMIDKTLLASIVNRVENIEKKDIFKSTANLKDIENELKDIKSLILNHIIKYEKYINENNNRFEIIENTLNDILNRIDFENEENINIIDDIGDIGDNIDNENINGSDNIQLNIDEQQNISVTSDILSSNVMDGVLTLNLDTSTLLN